MISFLYPQRLSIKNGKGRSVSETSPLRYISESVNSIAFQAIVSIYGPLPISF
jgi:fructose-1,6-bisphosphatase